MYLTDVLFNITYYSEGLISMFFPVSPPRHLLGSDHFFFTCAGWMKCGLVCNECPLIFSWYSTTLKVPGLKLAWNTIVVIQLIQNKILEMFPAIPWKINLENLLAKQFDHFRISRYITEFIDVFVTVWYTCFTAIAVTTEPLFFKKIPQLFRYIFRFPIPFYHHHHQFLREGKGFYFPWENRDLPPQTKKARKCAAQVRFLSKKACYHQ